MKLLMKPESFNIGLISGSRADLGLWQALSDALKVSDELSPRFYFTGSLADASHPARREWESHNAVDFDSVASDITLNTTVDMGKATAELMFKFCEKFSQSPPHILMVLGDRYEMYAGAMAAYFCGIPLVHIHGGESSEGAIDEGLRNSISHVASLHFTASDVFREKLIRMGIPESNILVSGAPGLDRLRTRILPDRTDTLRFAQLSEDAEYLLVTFHPVTRLPDLGIGELQSLIEALEDIPCALVITTGSGDAGAKPFHVSFEQLKSRRQADTRIIENAGETWYPALLKHARGIIGNSSSALIEAPFLGTPALNIGIRQKGRLYSSHTLQAEAKPEAIRYALHTLLHTDIRNQMQKDFQSPYGDGFAVSRMMPFLLDFILTLYSKSTA